MEQCSYKINFLCAARPDDQHLRLRVCSGEMGTVVVFGEASVPLPTNGSTQNITLPLGFCTRGSTATHLDMGRISIRVKWAAPFGHESSKPEQDQIFAKVYDNWYRTSSTYQSPA